MKNDYLYRGDHWSATYYGVSYFLGLSDKSAWANFKRLIAWKSLACGMAISQTSRQEIAWDQTLLLVFQHTQPKPDSMKIKQTPMLNHGFSDHSNHS